MIYTLEVVFSGGDMCDTDATVIGTIDECGNAEVKKVTAMLPDEHGVLRACDVTAYVSKYAMIDYEEMIEAQHEVAKAKCMWIEDRSEEAV